MAFLLMATALQVAWTFKTIHNY